MGRIFRPSQDGDTHTNQRIRDAAVAAFAIGALAITHGTMWGLGEVHALAQVNADLMRCDAIVRDLSHYADPSSLKEATRMPTGQWCIRTA